jgi:hypothetical protein
MAAGQGFKTFATGDVLTAPDVNGYLMQGVLVFASAAARTAAITSPQQGQVSFLKDSNTTQYYSGSAWVTVGGGSSPLTTKGDLYTYSTTDARLGVGTNGQTLVADSTAATGIKWATPSSGTPAFVGCSLYSTTSQSLTNNTITAITYNAENFDTDSFHDNSTNTSRVTIPTGKAGKYLINFMTNCDGGYSGIWETWLYKNGSSLAGVFATPSFTSPYNYGAFVIFSGVFEFAVADYFEMYMRQTAGSAKSIYNNSGGGYLNATYLGA